MNMRLSLLGPVQIECERVPVTDLSLGKPLALLGYIAVHIKPLPREHLADLFWPDLPGHRGCANLSWMLHKLTTTMPQCLHSNRHSVQYNRDNARWLDIDTFQTLVNQGDIHSYTQAAKLYRGDFLEGMSLDGCADFEIWLLAERERWRQRTEGVLGTLVKHHAGIMDYEEALQYCRKLLELAPWREETHRQMIRILAQKGQRGRALAQFEICCQMMESELGVSPSVETVRLYEDIRDDKIIKKVHQMIQPYQ